ncbi:MAG TPA: GldG family protein [Candidatus Sulfotelmatobacter sp.]|nr:GldG family protein [Candidatus Sulfotelmatobacter sp.]
MSLQKLGTLAGAAGALLLVLGGIVYLFQPALPGWLVAVLLAGAILLLFGAYAHFGAIARQLARRQTRYGLNVLAMAVLLMLVIGFVEFFSARYNKRLDLTEGRRYTLSPQTVKVVRELKKPVKAVAFFRAGGTGAVEDRRAAEDLLRQYADLSSNFRYEFVDPDKDIGLARRYKITMYGTVVLETPEEDPGLAAAKPLTPEEAPAPATGDAKAAKAAPEAAAKKAGAAPAVAERAMREEQLTEVSEERLTNAVVKLTRSGRRTIYFSQGHGEGGITDAGERGFGLLRQEVEKSNYVVKDLLLARDKEVPQDATAAVILGPQRDIPEAELAVFDAYLARGGKLLIMTDPLTGASLKPFLAKYAISLGNDIVISRQFPLGTGPQVPAVNRYGNHPITRDLQGILTIFPLVRSVDAAEKPGEGVSVEKLIETPAYPVSWAQPDSQREIQYDAARDRKGPVPIALVATIGGKAAAAGDARKPEQAPRPAKARVVVFGNSRFASNPLLRLEGNRDLVMNAISWLAEEEDLIAIRPRDAKSAPLLLAETQAKVFWFVPLVVLPAAVAGVGVGVFVRRRRYR